MKTRSIVVTFVLCLLALSASFAQNPNIGTWKLNEAKSNIPAGVDKTQPWCIPTPAPTSRSPPMG